MTTELVTAHAGTNHVGSEDIGALYAGALGSGRYALDVDEGMAVSMKDANTLRIGTGGFVFDGRWVRVTDAEEVKVQSGYQAAFRKDLVTYTYTRDPSSGNVEAGEWGVVMGTAASKEADAKLPTVPEASILDRDLKVVCPVAEVDIAGLTPTAKLLLPSVKSLKTLGESVSPSATATASDSCGVVARHGGQILVVATVADTWGYDGNTVRWSVVSRDGLTRLGGFDGGAFAGNGVGRTATCFALFAGAVEGKTYTFGLSVATGSNGSSAIRFGMFALAF